MESASKEWMDQFRFCGGATVITCGCGRTHVSIDSIDLSDEERQDYLARASEKPKNYVLHKHCDAVTEKTINGQCVVDECECGMMAKFENFVLRERELILGYYRALADKAVAQAASLNSGLARIEP